MLKPAQFIPVYKFSVKCGTPTHGTGKHRNSVIHAMAVDTVIYGKTDKTLITRHKGQLLCTGVELGEGQYRKASGQRVTCARCLEKLDVHQLIVEA